MPSSRGIFPTQGSNPGLRHCRQILYHSLPPQKPKNTGLGSLSLLQGKFPTQESNRGLLHCRWILYQLSYPGSPTVSLLDTKNSINQHFLEFMWCGESILINPSSEGFCSCFPIPPILLDTSQNSKSVSFLRQVCFLFCFDGTACHAGSWFPN